MHSRHRKVPLCKRESWIIASQQTMNAKLIESEGGGVELLFGECF